MYKYLYICMFLGITASSQNVLQQRIIGGDFAKQSKFAFVASIRNSWNQFLCAGAIIDKYWVVTAAECVFRQQPNNLQVVVGTTELNSGGAIHRVILVRPHPYFFYLTKENNIALLKLMNKIVENKYVETIRVAKSTISDGKDMELAGWGSITKPPRGYTNSLRFVELKTYPFSDCKKALPRIYNYNICTKGKTSKGACTADVGGPLIKRGGFFSTTELHGIVSQYTHCADGLPDVYVSVAAFKLWIDQEMAK